MKAANSSALATAALPVTPSALPATLSVLLIEDDLVDELALLRTVGREALPYRVQVARSLADARALLQSFPFDVILADHQLPDGTSFELMDLFGDRLVIFITGAWDATVAAKALRVGVHDYLLKDDGRHYLQLLNYRVQALLRQQGLAKQLRDSEARLQAILDHAPAAICAHDLAGRLTLSNRHHANLLDADDSVVDRPVPGGEGEDCEQQRTHRDGSLHTYLTVRFAMPDALGRPQGSGEISVDISARKQAEQLIHKLAYIDTLTALPNRRMLLDRLNQALATSARHGGHGALFFIDLDRFKALNDTLGHDHGDMLLVEVARRLLACVRGEDTVARIGGDEFVVMTVGLAKTERAAAAQATLVGKKILAAVGEPCQLGVYQHRVTPSIGVGLFRGRSLSPDEVIKRADLAMYQAKAAGRGTLRFFDPAMQAVLEARSALEADLGDCVAADQLRLFGQVQMDAGGDVVGVELLLRWQHPRLGLLLPDQFLPLAEQTGQILPIARWVIVQACAQLGQWARHAGASLLTVAVNLSHRQFYDIGFADQLMDLLRQHQVPRGRLRLELRDTVVQDKPAQAHALMDRLSEAGVLFTLDDFGINLASMPLLKSLPLDQVKLSSSLVTDLAQDLHSQAIVSTIVGIAASLKLGVAAAGVETVGQRDCLQRLGCQRWQGHLSGLPELLATVSAQQLAPSAVQT